MEDIQSYVSLCNKYQFMDIYVGKKISDTIFQTRLDLEKTHHIIKALHEWATSISSRENVTVQYHKNIQQIHQFNTTTVVGYDDIRQYTGGIVFRKSTPVFYYQVFKVDVDTTALPSGDTIHREVTYDVAVFHIHGQFTVEIRTYQPGTDTQYHECVVHIEKPLVAWKLNGCIKALEAAISE